MKKISFLLFFAALCSCVKNDYAPGALQASSVDKSTTAGKKIYFKNAGTYIGKDFPYNPGDTFVLTSDITYDYFSLGEIHGTSESPVVIINEGHVTLRNGFNFSSCTHIKLTGSGSADQYGFEITNNNIGVAIDINRRSANIEVERVFIHNKTYGFWVKQEVDCADSLNYPNWWIDSISLHDNYIVHTTQEGMYLGSTGQNADRQMCGKYPYPLRLSNIKVYNNRIDSTWRGGIQLSGADRGVNEIFNNTVTNCGFEGWTYQGNGIVLGGNTTATVKNNFIRHTLCAGIFSLGAGLIKIRSNDIDYCGNLGSLHADGMSAIMLDARPSYPFKQIMFRLHDNKIGSNLTDAGIRIYNTKQNNDGNYVCGFTSTGNLILGNIPNISILVEAGIIYQTQK